MNTTLVEQQDLMKTQSISDYMHTWPYVAHPLPSMQGPKAPGYTFQMPERLNTGGLQGFTSAEEIGSGIIYSDVLGVFTMSANRYSCMKLVQELPDAALPETIETLTDLRDHYRSLENPSIRRPTPPLEYDVKPHVSPTE